jgi:hypothetical protein
VRYPIGIANLESTVLDACASEEEWPAQIAAGIYAGVDYAIAHPEVVEGLDASRSSDAVGHYEVLVGRLAGFLRVRAPIDERLPGSTDEALIAGVVGLVGDHLRIGRVERLVELRADLVLLTLLPYLGFAEAQRWANELESRA